MQEKIKIDKIIPCLPAQHGFLVDSEAGSSNIYRQQITVLIDKSTGLDSDTLEKNIRNMQKRCDILRTVFDWSTGKEVQVVLSGIPPRISFTSGDIENLRAKATDELDKLDTIRDEPPVRFLITTIDKDLYLTVTYHHILFDGPSIAILLDSITSSSDKYPEKDSTSGYLKWLNSNISNHDRQFWRNALSTLPNDDVDVFNGARNSLTEHSAKRYLSDRTSSALLKLARSYKVSLATLMQAICSEWLVGYFNMPVMYGSVLSTRELEVNYDFLGPFINTVPIHVSSSITSGSLRNTAMYMQKLAMSMYKAKHVPIRDITELVPSHSLFFDIILTITTAPVQSRKGLYKIISTHENTGFPLSIDIDADASRPISILFTSVLHQEDFDITKAVESLEDYCNKRILYQNDPVYIEPYATFQTRKKIQQQTISMSTLTEKIAKVLNASKDIIDVQKSFILNGGDSILALKLKNELGLDGFKVAVGQIIRKDSLLELAKEIIYSGVKHESAPIAKGSLHTPSAISYILNAYKLGYEQDYHEQAAFYIEGKLNVDIFKKAVLKLVDETISLNLSYSLQDISVATRRSGCRSKLHILESVPKNLNSFVKNVSRRDLEEAFDPSSGPLLRIYISIASNGWYLFLSFSALVTDGWSFSILLERLFVIYSSLLNSTSVEPRTDNLLVALPLMTNNSCSGMLQKNSIYNTTVNSFSFALSKQESNHIHNMANKSHMTPSQYFEKIVISLSHQLNIERILIYESGRDIDINVADTIGPFSYLRAINLSEQRGDSFNDLYYVYENYPRDNENRLREDRIAEFKERGVWRRPLLPPTSTIGIVVDIIDESYAIDILIRSNIEEEEETIEKRASNVFNLMKGVMNRE